MISSAEDRARLDVKLTKNQEECINSKANNLLIKGIAGSGKTLVLLRKAVKLKREAINNKENIKIGFFTYANTLTRYSQDLVNEIEDNNGMISVNTFHSHGLSILKNINTTRKLNIIYGSYKDDILKNSINQMKIVYSTNKILNKELDFWIEEISWIKGKKIYDKDSYINTSRIGRGTSYRLTKKDKEVVFKVYEDYNKRLRKSNKIDFDDISNLILDNFEFVPRDKRFDYVLVDEAQDLSYCQLLVLKMLAKKSIIIAADHAQKIYNNSFTWKELGINVQGNASKSLGKNFRSTKEIMNLANSLIVKNESNKGRDTDYELGKDVDGEGNKPIIYKCNTITKENEIMVELLKELNDGETVIGIPVRTNSKVKRSVIKALNDNNLEWEEVSKEKDVPWSILTPGIKVVTMHSAKGLEFDVVIIPRVNDGMIPKIDENEDDEAMLEQERSLLYVAMTRAKEDLYLITSKGSRFIDEMDRRLYEMDKIQ
ncbi:3'-5' exonuclease [Terrisporobacter vanillatitrophus]|uniref:3'-5' exonuclease n=1 Tax=Terrisporobacter vanillatitrophus TaxID=3058402 RepID=UPI003365CFD7